MATVFFYIPDQLHLLDLSGVLQAFQESNYLGEDYQFQFIGNQESIDTSSGLSLASIVSFEGLATTQEDIIFIPGFDTHQAIKSEEHQDFFAWLNEANQAGTSICSICTGAFFLAKSGLLSDRSCTTHWRYVKKLAQDFPSLRVQANVLFTKDENIYTSAGIVTGIDLALFLLEERHGAQHAAEVAKELVVYKRRQGTDSQESVYLQYRNHHDERIHKVQDWIVHNLEKAATLESLAELVHLSPRNLTRLFKSQTGITISDFRNQVRVEKAKSLLTHSEYKVEHIARLCGYSSPKQLRTILKQQLGYLPSRIRTS